MTRLEKLLDEYGESHRHPVNKIIHWLCVPVIVWSVVAFLWLLPFPLAGGDLPVPLNWAVVALLLAQAYWFSLSLRLGLGLLLYNLFMIQLVVLIEYSSGHPLWLVAGVAFVLSWIGQFLGHLVEGRRPSFFRDLQFLLVGPAWLMARLYRAAGLRY